MKNVIIYTDGACRGNPGPGGWGAILLYGDKEKELFGGEPETTNNRMELMAAIVALETLNAPCQVVLTTDSKYVMDGITKWMANWKSVAGKRPRSSRSRMWICGSALMQRCSATKSTGSGSRATVATRVMSVPMRWLTGVLMK